MFNSDFLMISYFFLIGACLGSFANVVIYRLPQSISLLGRSYCYKCNNKISWYCNIPIVSFLYLRGRCASCKAKFSIRYLIVEFLMGLLFSLVYYHYGISWTGLEYLLFTFALVAASFIDYDHMILPDEITLGGLVIGLIGAALNPERDFVESLMGVLIGGGILWLVAYIYFLFTGREGLGGGDIKLLAWMGALLGWKAIPFIILCSSLIGSFTGLIISHKNKTGLKTMIPFGPFLALGAILYLLGLKSVGIWYLQLFFPNI